VTASRASTPFGRDIGRKSPPLKNHLVGPPIATEALKGVRGVFARTSDRKPDHRSAHFQSLLLAMAFLLLKRTELAKDTGRPGSTGGRLAQREGVGEESAKLEPFRTNTKREGPREHKETVCLKNLQTIECKETLALGYYISEVHTIREKGTLQFESSVKRVSSGATSGKDCGEVVEKAARS